MLRVTVVAIVIALLACNAQAQTSIGDARQLVVVLIDDWNSTQGTLRTFDDRAGEWVASGARAPISIGKSGAAWGLGLHDAQAGLQKREGDGRSPAGAFAIGPVFGYSTASSSRLPYLALSRFDYCIDVNESPHYNQIVDSRRVGEHAVARSTEPMRRDLHANGDQRYKLGFVIQHNPANVSGRGSCIFAHLWGSAGQTTAGCTAMNESAMRELVTWLRPEAQPVFVLLPIREYERLQRAWRLPPIEQLR